MNGYLYYVGSCPIRGSSGREIGAGSHHLCTAKNARERSWPAGIAAGQLKEVSLDELGTSPNALLVALSELVAEPQCQKRADGAGEQIGARRDQTELARKQERDERREAGTEQPGQVVRQR